MHILTSLKTSFITLLEWIIVITYILFEQLIWETFAEPIVRFVKQLAPLKKFALWINQQNPHSVLAIFILLFACVETLGIYAGMLFIRGELLIALGVYFTKIPIASFTFWLFGISKEKLLHFSWFARLYFWIMYLIDKIKTLDIYIDAKKHIVSLKRYIKHLRKDENTFFIRLKLLYQKVLTKEA